MHLKESGYPYTRILTPVEHLWELQTVQNPPGSGKGVMYVLEGHLVIQNVVKDLLRLDIVFQVSIQKDYLVISVQDPHRWKEVEGHIEQIVARNLDETNKSALSDKSTS
jgi:hypothetical protein